MTLKGHAVLLLPYFQIWDNFSSQSKFPPNEMNIAVMLVSHDSVPGHRLGHNQPNLDGPASLPATGIQDIPKDPPGIGSSLPFCDSHVYPCSHQTRKILSTEGKRNEKEHGSNMAKRRKKVQVTLSEREEWGWNDQLGSWWLSLHFLILGLDEA